MVSKRRQKMKALSVSYLEGIKYLYSLYGRYM